MRKREGTVFDRSGQGNLWVGNHRDKQRALTHPTLPALKENTRTLDRASTEKQDQSGIARRSFETMGTDLYFATRWRLANPRSLSTS